MKDGEMGYNFLLSIEEYLLFIILDIGEREREVTLESTHPG